MVTLEYALQLKSRTKHRSGHLWLEGVRPQIPPFVLRRFPPDHPIHHSCASCSDDTESEEDEEFTIPQSANGFFNIVDGTPGLHISTRNTSSWTPIATRTRSECKSIASVK